MEMLQLREHVPVLETVGTVRPEDQVLVFTIHDGDLVPRSLLGEDAQALMARPDVRQAHLLERDWGANRVAEQLARRLGLGGYLRVRLPRILLDFGRLPGVSKEGAPYLLRKSIYPPMEGLLSIPVKRQLIEEWYASMSEAFALQFAGRRLNIAVHTYDRTNANGTVRPEVSLVTRSLEYQRTSDIPQGIFDPMFPAYLCESTCPRLVSYQMLLNAERCGRHTALNYPYLMPAGSVEIRAQVYFFFRYLRGSFERAYPETVGSRAFERIWHMLLDVTCFSYSADQLRLFLHAGTQPPEGEEELFAEARKAYAVLAAYLAEHEQQLVPPYQRWQGRPGSLGIEVRKDLLTKIDLDGLSVQPSPDADDQSRDVAEMLASGVREHLASVADSPSPSRSAPADLALV